MDYTNTYLKGAAEHAALAAVRILQGDEKAARQRLVEALQWLDKADDERKRQAETTTC